MKIFYQKLERFSIKNQRTLQRVCTPLFDAFDIRQFFYQFVKKNGDYNFIGTHNDLMGYYFDANLHLCNPFITQTDNSRSGIYLMDSVLHAKYQQSLKQLEEKFRAKHFLSIMKHDGNCCHQFGFFIPPANCSSGNLLVNHLSHLDRFIAHFEKEMAPIIRQMHDDPVDLTSLLGQSFGTYAKGIADITLSKERSDEFLAKILRRDQLLSSYRLSKAERECVPHIRQGKTARQIAKALFRSVRTIELHINNIKHKLGCTSKSELTAKLQQML